MARDRVRGPETSALAAAIPHFVRSEEPIWRARQSGRAAASRPPVTFGSPEQARFSLDRRFIFVSGDGTFRAVEVVTGRTVSPVLDVSGGSAFFLSRDGSRAVLSGTGESGSILELADFRLVRSHPDQGPLIPNSAELFSGQTISMGGALSALTKEEWLRRWRVSRASLSASRSTTFTTAQSVEWHRRQAQFAEDHLDFEASRWHCDRLNELGGQVDRG